MKKTIPFILLSALAVTACDKVTTSNPEKPAVEQKATENKSVDDKAIDAPIKKDDAQPTASQPTTESSVTLVTKDYDKLSQVLAVQEAGLKPFEQKLQAFSEGKLTKEQANSFIQELTAHTTKMVSELKGLSLTTNQVNALREQSVKTLDLTNEIMANTVTLLSLDVNNTDAIKAQYETVQATAAKLQNEMQELHKLDASIRAQYKIANK